MLYVILKIDIYFHKQLKVLVFVKIQCISCKMQTIFKYNL